jgi:PAS domain S-box-containing protein
MVLDDDKKKSFSLWQKAVIFGAAYFLCAEIGDHLSAHGGGFITFWLPAGLYLAGLLVNRTRDWPWLVLAVLPANFIFDYFYGTRFVETLAFYCANTIQALTGAWLVRRFVAERPSLATLKEFFGLLGLAVVFSAMMGAVIGAATVVHFGFSRSFEQSWKIWWGSNAMAILVLTPFILAWFPKMNGLRNFFSPPKKIAEATLLFFGLSIYITYLLTTEKGIMSPNKSLAIPFLLWAGLRFGAQGATAASLFLSMSLAFFTTQFSIGLSAAQIASGDYVFPFQTVLAMASMVALVPAIVIGERNRTLAELRVSEERLKNLSAAAFEGIFISENGRILDVNDQGLKMFGYDRSEMIGKQIAELVAPESRAMVAEAVRTRRETIYGHQLVRRDGSFFFAEAQARMVHAGDQTLRMTALRDITERKRAEEALQENQRMLTTLLSNLPGMVYRCQNNLDWTMEFVSEGSRELTGYLPEDFLNNKKVSYGQITHPEDNLYVWDAIQSALRERRQFELTYRIRTADGAEKWVWERGRGIFSDNGALIALEGFITDITSKRQAELEHVKAVQREQQARAEYTFQLIASQEAERTRIARELHDSLGQNLLLIKNRAQLEMSKAKLPDAAREEFQGISDLASQAIAEVRQISRDLHPHQIELLGLTRALRTLIESAHESSAVTISGKFDSSDDLFPREAATNIYRIVQESLNNILKHSHAKKARVTLERDVHEVLLKIEDDGCGFKTAHAGDGGKGLGLKNIAERVRMLGGKIRLDSQPDKGTRIEITIPISAEHG